MYWWNAGKLAEGLREGRVDEKERFKYFLATFIAWNLVVQLFFFYGGSFEITRLIPPMAVNLAVTILGITFCYGVNKSGDHNDFIGRMICLGWPGAVRTMALFLVGFLFILAATWPLERETTISEAIGSFLRWFFWIVIWVCFSTVWVYLARVAQPKGMTERAVRLSEKAMLVILGGGAGGSIVWVIIAQLGLPLPLQFFLGITLTAGLVWLLLRWLRKYRAITRSQNGSV